MARFCQGAVDNLTVQWIPSSRNAVRWVLAGPGPAMPPSGPGRRSGKLPAQFLDDLLRAGDQLGEVPARRSPEPRHSARHPLHQAMTSLTEKPLPLPRLNCRVHAVSQGVQGQHVGRGQVGDVG